MLGLSHIIIYINDMVILTTLWKFVLYVDDKNVYSNVENVKTAHEKANKAQVVFIDIYGMQLIAYKCVKNVETKIHANKVHTNVW